MSSVTLCRLNYLVVVIFPVGETKSGESVPSYPSCVRHGSKYILLSSSIQSIGHGLLDWRREKMGKRQIRISKVIKRKRFLLILLRTLAGRPLMSL